MSGEGSAAGEAAPLPRDAAAVLAKGGELGLAPSLVQHLLDSFCFCFRQWYTDGFAGDTTSGEVDQGIAPTAQIAQTASTETVTDNSTTAGKEISLNLKTKQRLSLTLQQEEIFQRVAARLVDQLLERKECSNSNKVLLNMGTRVLKALRRNPHQVFLEALPNYQPDIDVVVANYELRVNESQKVFQSITSHHNSISAKNWTSVVQDELSLSQYGQAAYLMGERRWVREGNDWMENFALNFFRRNGSRNFYVKQLRRHLYQLYQQAQLGDTQLSTASMDKFQRVREIEDLVYQYASQLPKDLMAETSENVTRSDNEIRVLDIGSCYNPIGTSTKYSQKDVSASTLSCSNTKGSESSVFAVTALDLYPKHPSVYYADFLNVSVGPSDSSPVIKRRSVALGEKAVEGVDNLELVQLPAASFDVVTISLVLSYLPNHSQRETMIMKARELLISQPNTDQLHRSMEEKLRRELTELGIDPRDFGKGEAAGVDINMSRFGHDRGLLLIVEKESIFPRSEKALKNIQQKNTSQEVMDVMDRTADAANLLHNWKRCICNMGFELMHYDLMIASDKTHRSHVFAFVTTSSINTNYTSEIHRLWIKQDFEREKIDVQLEESSIEKAIDTSTSSKSSTKQNNSENRKPIGIVGGGLGGTALALLLQRKQIPFLLFEKDKYFAERRQGYAFTIQQGNKVMRSMGLGEALLQFGVICREHLSFDSTGKALGRYGKLKGDSERGEHDGNESVSRIDSDSDSYESEEDTEQSQGTSSEIKRKRIRYNVQIARQTIRKLFIDNISPSNILWNKSLDSYEWMPRVEGSDVNSYGNMKVKFKDNSEYNISMLVAADGIYSPVRKILEPANSAHQLQYLGLMVILGISSVSSKALSELVGCSGDKYRQMQWVDGKSRIFSMPYNSNKTMWQFSYPLSEEDANILSTSRLTSDGRGLTVEDQGKILLDAALQQCKGWCPAVQKLVTETDCSLISGHPVYDRDPITPEALQEWKEMFQSSVNNKKRKLDEQFVNQDKFIPMTFIGDAVHPMSPFKGQGANQALLDAFSLTKAILNSEFCGKGRRPVAEAILDYERQMCTRSKEKVLKSREAAKSLHSPAALVEADMTRASAATQVAE